MKSVLGISDVLDFTKPASLSEMPKQIKISPTKLEDQCMHVYLNYLHDEVHLMFHLKNFQDRSVLLRQYGLAPDRLYDLLQSQLSNSLQGILHDIVRQKMLDILISQMHLFINDMQKMFAVGRPPAPLYSRQETCLSARKSSSFGMDNQGTMHGGEGAAPWLYALAGAGGANIRGAGGGIGNNGGAAGGNNNLANGQGALNNPANANGSHGGSSGNTLNAVNNKNTHSVQQYRALPIFQLFELILHKDLRIIGISNLEITLRK